MTSREFSFEELKEENVVSVVPYQESYKRSWDEFVRASNNGTIFHTRRFLSYHPADRFQDCSLLFKKNLKTLSVLPATSQLVGGEKYLVSHAGASMAGPVFKLTTSLKDTFFVVQKLTEFARQNNFTAVKMTLPPLIYHTRPGNYFDFALLEYGFTYLKREVSSVIPLDFNQANVLQVFSPEARRATRKAMKLGVQVKESEDFATFYAILQRNLKMRHNVRPTHTLNELQTLKRLYPDDVRLFSAEVDGEMIAGVVLFICNVKVGLAFYISHLEDRQTFRGVNLLFYEVIRWSIQRKLQYLDFGIFTVNMKPNWGLARFKESFGALGVFRDTFIKRFDNLS